MTLDEAIQHAEEVARQNEEDAIIYSNCKKYKKNLYEIGLAENAEKKCCKCAEEHRQLAAWLKELKAYRAQEQNRFKEIKKEVKARSYYINYHNGCVETGLSTKDILGIIDKYA